jgi:hypothetical protein
MAKVRTYSLDALQKIRKELKKQEQPKRHRELSTRAAILELKSVLEEKLAAGWTVVDLADSLSEAGLPIAPKTLKEYLETDQDAVPESRTQAAPRRTSGKADSTSPAAEPAVAKPGTEAAPAGFVVMKEDEL